jgi:hypothetical protein
MTMEGRRFGIGLAAGLLVAFAVVAASGGLASTLGSLSPTSANPAQSAATSISSTTMIYTSTVPASITYTVTMSTTTSESYPIGSLNTNATTIASSSASTQTSSSAITFGANGQKNLTSALSTPRFSSSFGSIAQQPALSNAIVLVPIIIALLGGTVLYRASVQGKEEAGEE